MAEFKFSCPQCSQHIQCDTSYAGMQIDCPVCKNSIIVPPPPRAAAPRVASAAAPVTAKKSRVLQKTLYVVATVIILAALVIGGWYGYSKFKFGHLPPGSVAVWSVEGNGVDPAGGHNGEVMPGVGFEPGKGGRAFHFTGNDNSYVKVPDAPELRLTNVLTITFWFKKLQLQGRPYGEYIINKGGDWTRGELNYGVSMDPDSIGTGVAFLFAGGNRHAGNITDTEWHHYAIIATNGEPDPVFYIDGQIQTINRREGSATINLFPSTDPLYIGAQVDAASGYFYYSKTMISELAIYNRALSAEEIRRLYASQK
jgi:hypothetical protein